MLDRVRITNRERSRCATEIKPSLNAERKQGDKQRGGGASGLQTPTVPVLVSEKVADPEHSDAYSKAHPQGLRMGGLHAPCSMHLLSSPSKQGLRIAALHRRRTRMR